MGGCKRTYMSEKVQLMIRITEIHPENGHSKEHKAQIINSSFYIQNSPAPCGYPWNDWFCGFVKSKKKIDLFKRYNAVYGFKYEIVQDYRRKK